MHLTCNLRLLSTCRLPNTFETSRPSYFSPRCHLLPSNYRISIPLLLACTCPASSLPLKVRCMYQAYASRSPISLCFTSMRFRIFQPYYLLNLLGASFKKLFQNDSFTASTVLCIIAVYFRIKSPFTTFRTVIRNQSSAKQPFAHMQPNVPPPFIPIPFCSPLRKVHSTIHKFPLLSFDTLHL